MNKILRVFFETNMCYQHSSLKRIASEVGVTLDALDHGEHIVFVNANLTKMKVYSSNGVLSYINKGKDRINLSVIEKIPQSFSSTKGIIWKQAEKLALLKQLKEELTSSTKGIIWKQAEKLALLKQLKEELTSSPA